MEFNQCLRCHEFFIYSQTFYFRYSNSEYFSTFVSTKAQAYESMLYILQRIALSSENYNRIKYLNINSFKYLIQDASN